MEYLPFGETLVEEHLNSNNSPYKFNAKELDAETGNYYYRARYYDPKFSILLSVDPLAEMYAPLSSYAFVANNPIGNREIDGRYFEEGSKSERQAKRIERRAERQANRFERKADRLDRKDGNSGDLRDRVGELRQSAQDVRDMRNDKSTEFKYAKFGGKESQSLNLVGPTTTMTGQNSNGDNVVTMFTEKNMGNQIHETRHGGDVARGTLTFDNNGGYGVSHEVSAYRAQYSWDGKIDFIDVNKNPTQAQILNSLQTGSNPLMNTIKAINQINPNFVNSLVDPGFVPIYPPSSIPLNIWNSN